MIIDKEKKVKETKLCYEAPLATVTMVGEGDILSYSTGYLGDYDELNVRKAFRF